MNWGSCVASLDRAEKWLLPGLADNSADGDTVFTLSGDSIATVYNTILCLAGDGPVVLLHDDTELYDGARQAILDGLDRYDVVGAIGACEPTSLAWWESPVRRGIVGETRGLIAVGEPGPVDTVDGLLIALSAKAAQLRFDEDYPGFHGYDADICAQALHAGLTVGVVEIPLFHHTKGGYGNKQAWDEADRRYRRKWVNGG